MKKLELQRKYIASARSHSIYNKMHFDHCLSLTYRDYLHP